MVEGRMWKSSLFELVQAKGGLGLGFRAGLLGHRCFGTSSRVLPLGITDVAKGFHTHNSCCHWGDEKF